MLLVLEPFINVDETGTGCRIIQIKSSQLLLGTTSGASWMQAKKEHNKHRNLVLIKGGAIFLSWWRRLPRTGNFTWFTSIAHQGLEPKQRKWFHILSQICYNAYLSSSHHFFSAAAALKRAGRRSRQPEAIAAWKESKETTPAAADKELSASTQEELQQNKALTFTTHRY